MSESERPLPERLRGRARPGPQRRTRAERVRRRRDRANSGARLVASAAALALAGPPRPAIAARAGRKSLRPDTRLCPIHIRGLTFRSRLTAERLAPSRSTRFRHLFDGLVDGAQPIGSQPLPSDMEAAPSPPSLFAS